MKLWSWWTDSNPRPADYKSAALPAELHQQFQQRYLSYQNIVHLSTDFFAFLQYFLGGIGLNKRNCSACRVVRCTLCGREIIMNEEYWCCNGAQVCRLPAGAGAPGAVALPGDPGTGGLPMTLLEMSVQYAERAAAIRERITMLREWSGRNRIWRRQGASGGGWPSCCRCGRRPETWPA